MAAEVQQLGPVLKSSSGSGLAAARSLSTGQCLVSKNMKFFAKMQGDGNLCVYAGTPLDQGAFKFGTVQATG